MKKEDHLDVESAKEFVEEHCQPVSTVEAQAKEAAWILYNELQQVIWNIIWAKWLGNLYYNLFILRCKV